MSDIKLIENLLELFGKANWSEYRKLFASDLVYEEVPTRTSTRGFDSYLTTLQSWKKSFPDLAGKIVRVIGGEDEAAVEVEWTGTQSGVFETPFGVIPPTNKRGTVKALLTLKYRDGKVVECHHYFDTMTVLANIGALPVMGIPATKALPTEVAKRH